MSRPYCIESDFWPGLSKLTEETGELQQVMGKLLGSEGRLNHWDGSNLSERLVEEMGDVMAALIFFSSHNYHSVPWNAVMARCDQKLAVFEKWRDEAIKQRLENAGG